MFDNLLDKELQKQMKFNSKFISIVIRNAMEDFHTKRLILLLVALIASAVLTGCNSRNEEQRPVAVSAISQDIKPDVVFSGTVTDLDGNPIKDAKLYILRRNSINVSGQQGEYEIYRTRAKFPLSRNTYIIARHEDKNLASATKVAPDTQKQDITLLPAFTAAGVVIDQDGNPIENAKVSFGFFAKGYITSFSEIKYFDVDRQGNYKVAFIPPKNRYSTRIYAEGYGSDNFTINSEDAVDGILELAPVVLLKADETVSGIVLTSDGKPVSKARIYRSGDHQPLGAIYTESDGTFTIDVCKGSLLIGASFKKDGTMLYGNSNVLSNSKNVKIVLGPRL